ncbi:DHA1 family bicyclomycin/chloramphenicol resistance-like MFS transporter [Saccharopolyspora erythraea NRRL 2338]|uniref:Drug resistance transporter, Bcr/CflA family n=2 Tax=Saccharopolyspora erythraea TaxID=1836 RepID=A4F7E6_SACEN|nr:multidrug effflux MFS transporter [Saccharopolyspora erythraea]EQD84816.1 MFS transporter [Saccharopolyspora erythraea D]PFG93772.1 DHA1 family bicyclomycin/chloramphenicol resistance-like MFS transporter [Saccharopolyspora erythraea NRRL 2338]QRK90609.1 multidrug effflux MFS transporter [Saccharopolyspora erythraea]CAL99970.1 drug resistance transporter, Bcr/CflA family [Saccharopolyspora erythraea NRRL 2338]
MPRAEEEAVEAGNSSLSRKARFALILGGLTAFGPLSIDMYLPALPELTRELGATEAQAQLTLTAVLLGLAFGQLFAGPVSDAVGRRKPLLAGLAVYIAATVLCALTESVHTLAVLRAVQGFGAAAGMVIARASVRDLYSGAEAARFFSSLMLVVGLAPILAPVIGGQVLAHTTWRGVFVVLTAFGVVLMAVAAFALPETKPKQWRQPARIGSTFRTFGTLLAKPSFLGCALAAGLAMAAMFAYVSGSSFVMQNIYGMSPQTYAMVFGANAIGLVAAGQVNARLVGRVATEAQLLTTALLTASVAGAVLVTTALLGLPLPVLLGALFVMISSLGFVMPNTTTLALAEHREVSGSASALLGVSQFVVGALAAPLVGMGGVGSALPMVSVMFGVILASAAVFLTLGRRGGPSQRIVATRTSGSARAEVAATER